MRPWADLERTIEGWEAGDIPTADVRRRVRKCSMNQHGGELFARGWRAVLERLPAQRVLLRDLDAPLLKFLRSPKLAVVRAGWQTKYRYLPILLLKVGLHGYERLDGAHRLNTAFAFVEPSILAVVIGDADLLKTRTR